MSIISRNCKKTSHTGIPLSIRTARRSKTFCNRSVNDQRVWINATQYFGGVPKAVWEFHVGGYQVCERWLKDRKGRKLTYEDIQHYQKTVVALNETIRLMTEIDKSIPRWPIT